MKKLFFLISMLLCVPALAQKTEVRTPDNDAIFNAINDTSSPFFYPALFSRYQRGDRSLTPEEYHYLYYGYAWQPGYSPLDSSPGVDEMLTVLESMPEPDSLGCVRIIAGGRHAMLKDPFNPMVLNTMAYAQTILGDTASARTNALRVERILKTIRSSGTGVSERSPWAVLSFSHASDVVASLGFNAANRRVVSRTVEYIDIGVRGEKVKGFFFDFSRVYWNKPEVMPEVERRGATFNGIKIR